MDKHCKAAKMIEESSLIIVKVGSDLIVNNHAKPSVRRTWLGALAQDVMALKEQGKQVVIVSSGAIALGKGEILRDFSTTNKTMTLHDKQGAAAYGQTRLMNVWQKAFAPCGMSRKVAQHLLTPYELANPKQRENAKTTINVILRNGGIPIINENDTVATKEITFGDNDNLSAGVSKLLGANLVVLLSNKIDGLYKDWGTTSAQLVPHVSKITRAIWSMANDTCTNLQTNRHSTGGMISKLKAAQLIMRNKGAMIIARGDVHHPLAQLCEKQICTCFCAG